MRKSDTSHYPKEEPFEVPEGWIWSTLGAISSYGFCPSIQVEQISDNSWVLELEDIEKDTGKLISKKTKIERSANGIRYSFERGQVLYSKLRTYLNKVLIAEQKGFCSTEIMPISFYGGVLAEYMVIVLSSPYFLDYTASCGYGVKMPRLGTNDAIKAAIPIPPLAEQRIIVRQVKQLLSLIDELSCLKETLSIDIENVKHRILELAIQGKLVPQAPIEEPAIELLRRINSNFQASDNLHYVECPSGWAVTQMKSIIDLLSGRDLDNSLCNTEGYGEPYLVGASCIDNGHINIYRWTENPEVISKKGDVLLSCKGTVGEVVLNTFGDIHIARQFMAIRSKAPQCILPDYLVIFIKASMATLKKAARGIIPGISRNDILELTVMIPPIEEQQRILSRIVDLNQSISQIVFNTSD